MLIALGRGSVPAPVIDVISIPSLDPDVYDLAREATPGWDVRHIEKEWRACAAASTPRCKLIPGIEYSSPGHRIHLLTWGLHSFLAEHRPVEETLAAVSAAPRSAAPPLI